MPNGRTNLIRLGALALASAATRGRRLASRVPASSGTHREQREQREHAGTRAATSRARWPGSRPRPTPPSPTGSIRLNAAIDKVKGAQGLGSGQATLAAYLGTDIAAAAAAGHDDPGRHVRAAGGEGLRAPSSPTSGSTSLVLPAAHIAGDAVRVTTTSVPNAAGGVDQGAAVRQPGQPGAARSRSSTTSTARSPRRRAPPTAWPRRCWPTRRQQWNANNNLLAPSKQSDAQADAAVAKGRQDVKEIRAIVKNHVQGSPDSPSAAGGTPTTT